jgi:hypothetical protein
VNQSDTFDKTNNSLATYSSDFEDRNGRTVPCGDASEELPPRFFQSLEARAETSMYDMIPEDFIAPCASAFRAGEAMRRPPAVKLLPI